MKNHLKRQKVPKNWPVHRKGTTFVVKSSSNLNSGIPVLIALRNILGLAQNRREVKKAIHLNNILLNNKPLREERQAIVLFDVLTIVPTKKYYRLELAQNGKFKLEEIKESSSMEKISKVIDKKVLKEKKVQLNLSDGRNYLSDLKCTTNDSVVINFKDNKVSNCLEFKENSNVLIFAGKHSGSVGIIDKIKPERKMASIKIGKENVNVLIKQLMVVK